jgi:hypothetical protein
MIALPSSTSSGSQTLSLYDSRKALKLWKPKSLAALYVVVILDLSVSEDMLFAPNVEIEIDRMEI